MCDMAKIDERAYPERMASVLGVSEKEVRRHLLEKPFHDSLRSRYFVDFGQILSLLPATGRILDLGVGTGWTSRFLAQCGYEVVGVDISETMIAYACEASQGISGLTFLAADYEQRLALGTFDAAVIYDALHHSEDEGAVISNVFHALNPKGVLITAEPGQGHSTQPHSIEAVRRFGVTEKDMDYARQREHMLASGFLHVHHHVRLSELTIVDLSKDAGMQQQRHLDGLIFNTVHAGTSSIVVAIKS
jgi:2-polyprenyl-3-methyl-5-hydroxy-6-metoxy-1,4-benzoquinol methylase